MTIVESLRKHRLLPVIQIEDAARAYGLAEALMLGGLPIAEVTLRTPAAVDAIEKIATLFPSVLVGAGTVGTRAQVDAVMDAGARFVVTPGFNREVVERCLEMGMPVIPGVCTPSDIELAMPYELDLLKFFPAEAAGGVKMLQALSGPYGNMAFVPTGGIGAHNVCSYLSQQNVLACGGSWMVNPLEINTSSFERIQKMVMDAVTIVSQPCDTEEEAA